MVIRQCLLKDVDTPALGPRCLLHCISLPLSWMTLLQLLHTLLVNKYSLLCGCFVVALSVNKCLLLQMERPPELAHIEQFSLDPTEPDHIVARMLRTFAQHEFENLLLVWSIKSGHFAKKGELISENRWLQALDRYLQLIG